jgi:hypothetical protein
MTTETLRGVLNADGTLELEDTPHLPTGPVEVVLRSLSPVPAPTSDWWEYLQQVRLQAEVGGGPFRSESEIERERQAFREGDDRWENLPR